MAREPIRSYQNQLMNYGIGRAFADNKPVTRGQMAQAAIPEDPKSLLDNLRRLKMAGGLSRASEIVPNQAFSLPEDIFEATETVVGAGAVEPVDFGTGQFAPDGTPLGEPGTKIIPEGPKKPTPARIMGAGDEAAAQAMIAANEEAAQRRVDSVIDAKMNKDAIAGLLGDSGSPDKNKAVEDTFFDAMAEYKKILGEQEVDADPSTKKERLQNYMQEFSDITGIDLAGKVDKSQALMAMGLALMQNRAGKGFNVGRMLSSVGEAGQAAMPYLTAARKEAKQNRLLAGQYALEQEQNRLAQESARAKDANDFQQQMYLKWYESKLQREEDSLKAAQELEKAKLEGGADYNKKHEFKFATGSGDASSWSIPVIYDAKSPSGGIILKPDAMARKYIDGREGVEDALNLISEMRSAAQDIAEGGGTSKFAFDRVNSIAKALFPDLNTGKPSSEQEYAQGVNLIMGRFKRFLTQETGNGISNRDVEIWENEIMKKPSWFTNFDETNSALSNLEDIFTSKLSEYDAGLDFIFDPENLQESDFEKLTEKYGDVEDIKAGSGVLIFKDGKMVRK